MGIRTYPDKPRAYVDMDGVLADFDGAAKARGLTPDQAKIMPGLYQALPVMRDAIVGLAELEALGFDVWILTKIPRRNPWAATEKLHWIRAHLPHPLHDKVIITPDKGCVGCYRDVLIDDHPEWANACNFPGRVIPFTSWGQAVNEAENVLLARNADELELAGGTD